MAFKAVHVLAAVIWIGGGCLLMILGIAAERKRDPVELATVARQAAMVGEKFFAPAGIVVVTMGIAMMVNTNWGWGKFWVIAGLVGYAITFVTGVAVLSPRTKRSNPRSSATARARSSPSATHRTFLRVSGFMAPPWPIGSVINTLGLGQMSIAQW